MTKKIFSGLFFIFLFTGAHVTYAQQFQRLYGGTNDEISLVAVPAPGGGIYYVGATLSAGSGVADATLMKLDDDGQIIWARMIGSTYLDVAGAMTLATDGGIVCAGSTKSFNGNGPDDLYFFKTDSIGDLVWSKTFSIGTVDVASAILRTSDGGYAITGFTNVNSVNQVLLIRTDSNGDTLFTRIYGDSTSSNQGVELVESSDGGFVITGKTFMQTIGESDILMIRTDASGNVVWTKSFGGPLWDEGAGIIQLANGHYIISGSTISFGQGSFDMMLMETDSAGVILWSKTYGGPNTDAIYTVRALSDGSIVTSGYSNSMGYSFDMRMAAHEEILGGSRGDDSTNLILMKVSAIGDTIWTRSYGDGAKDEGFHFSIMPDGGYVIPGVSTSYTSALDSSQMLLVRTDSMGYSGCHEQDAHPVLDTTNFITQTLTPTVTSGFVVSMVTQNSLVWNETAEDACLYPGVAELSTQNILVYPNPASGIIHIENNSGIKKIELYNLQGKLIYHKNLSSLLEETTADVSEYAPGIYFLQLSTANSVVSKKIIIQKN